MSTSLEDRVEQLEARFAIMDLVADYSAAIDCRDLERFLACFTRDGVIRHADRSMRVEGREALRDYYTRRFGEYGMTFHYPHAHTISIDGRQAAHGTVTAHAEMSLDGEAWVAAFRYSDRYRCEDGRWRFAERELACWYYMPLAQLAQGMAGSLRKHYRGEALPAELPESLATYRAWHEG
jgi:uncharacterized protein (TIGR02246 family)